jgi:hypothetical protein
VNTIFEGSEDAHSNPIGLDPHDRLFRRQRVGEQQRGK